MIICNVSRRSVSASPRFKETERPRPPMNATADCQTTTVDPHRPRYAVYAMPAGAFADAGAAWLGWDARAGRQVAQPDLPGLPRPLSQLALRAGRYGFHATIKAPMALAGDCGYDDLRDQLRDLCGRLHPVEVTLELRDDLNFLAFRPAGGTGDLQDLAATVVRDLDPLRAELTEREITRRNPGALTPRQQELLVQFGYPYALEEFNLHVTLTEQLADDERRIVRGVAEDFFAAKVPAPWRIDELCILAEDAQGRFHLRDCCPLKG